MFNRKLVKKEHYLKILFPVIEIIKRVLEVARRGKCVSVFQEQIWYEGKAGLIKMKIYRQVLAAVHITYHVVVNAKTVKKCTKM